jgi:hypothetical protein
MKQRVKAMVSQGLPNQMLTRQMNQLNRTSIQIRIRRLMLFEIKIFHIIILSCNSNKSLEE